MAQNTSPIFLGVAKVNFSDLSTSAVVGTDGIDANVKTVFTANATYSSKVEDVYVVHKGTNASATVVRFWINNGSSAGTATNNTLVYEMTMALNTLTQVAASTIGVWRANLVLPAGYKILAASGSAISGGMAVTCVGGDYVNS
jgi:hypothetical protein